eukprot:TRINITY_DN17436_c0_g1_i2.p4 TRINITY_DN17436_c0_g1~~TRINITY_DN17436_c0_g1_i2.p4  ORF type:complete len:158 (+),score=16.17 TRINITY_DN17436_c0_g1_i2:643-1116(+)
MAHEIERKFLLDDIPFHELQNARKLNIMQGYLMLDEKSELRVRKIGNKYCITRKSGSGMVREESEQEINEGLFNFLWPLTEGKRVEKLRFAFEYDHHICELDIYSGTLSDLMVMEVEFDSEEDAKGFHPPPFVKREITEDQRYKNAILARFGKPSES